MSPPRQCIVCGAAGPFAPLYERDGMHLVRCPECGLVFQDPQPTADELARAYYYDEEFVGRLEGDLRPVVISRAREKLAFLADAGVEAGGEALDVGCSTGAWLEVARDAGWEPTGVEIGDAAAAAARARGFEVHTGTLGDALGALTDSRFSLVTFWDVLEHLHDPPEALRQAFDLLEPGGTVALTFPNVEGLYPRLTHRLIARPTGKWEYPELPVHLYDFSPSTARRLVTNAGLRPILVRTTEVPFPFYRATALHDQLAHHGLKGRALRLAFEALRAVAYPLARRLDAGNALVVCARRPA